MFLIKILSSQNQQLAKYLAKKMIFLHKKCRNIRRKLRNFAETTHEF